MCSLWLATATGSFANPMEIRWKSSKPWKSNTPELQSNFNCRTSCSSWISNSWMRNSELYKLKFTIRPTFVDEIRQFASFQKSFCTPRARHDPNASRRISSCVLILCFAVISRSEKKNNPKSVLKSSQSSLEYLNREVVSSRRVACVHRPARVFDWSANSKQPQPFRPVPRPAAREQALASTWILLILFVFSNSPRSLIARSLDRT